MATALLKYPPYQLRAIRVTGPTSYSTGGFAVTVSGVRRIIGAIVVPTGGYKASISWTGNTLTVVAQYYDYAATAAGTAIEVPAGTDLSGVNFDIIVIGD